jgi:hypothetical protein
VEVRDDHPCSNAKGIRQRSEGLRFWLDDDGWNGVCEDLSLAVRGSTFVDAKRKMEAALLEHVENILRQHSPVSRTKVA